LISGNNKLFKVNNEHNCFRLPAGNYHNVKLIIYSTMQPIPIEKEKETDTQRQADH
jgi:hypothetical protein